MNIKTETWAGHQIRFVEKESGEWWAVAKDIAEALDYRMASDMTRNLDEDEKDTQKVSTLGGIQNMSIISETGIYEAIFSSGKPDAKDFKKWVKQLLKILRQSSGLEGFEIFRTLDKGFQNEQMAKLCGMLKEPKRKDYIMANTIADKAISNIYGFPKMLKKSEMSPEMLVDRQSILEDTVNLMSLVDKYGMVISVSQSIYNGLSNKKTG
ncbi:prophage antirepressor-like protein [Anaerotaenia torta]|uniref:BRO-N domain-containing protein n=1 Tax=Anaerotaenia torta TaxID=433293 RepID=UPI003D1EC407